MNIVIEKNLLGQDALTFVYVFIFFLLTVLKLRHSKMFLELCMCFFSKTFFVDFENELSATFSEFKLLLFLIQNTILALFFCNIYTLQFSVDSTFELLFFFQVFCGISFYFLIQYFVGLGVSKIFQFSSLYLSIHALRFSYLKVISLLILPLVMYQNYAIYDDKYLISTVISVFLLFFLLLRLIIIVAINNKIFFERLFYFIVYLCTLEIVPLLIVYKLVVNN